ncbi:MAG: protein kinase [Gammaproteobacteria bacterium]|nr:protein kinase [Gammaproteobacteria bacterium]MBL6999215.1 protein kinase [Gammaproteobacteria bacterium]
MAVFGSFLFGRTLKQFLACKDLDSAKGQALIEKITAAAKDSLDTLLAAIPQTAGRHSDILKNICNNELNRDSEDHFLDNLDSDITHLRNGTKNLLSNSLQINPSKLFKRLHEKSSSKSEIIDILEFQQQNLAPELYVKNALKLDRSYAGRLFDIAQKNASRTDMTALNIDFGSLDNPDIKIMLVRFLAAVNSAEAAAMLCKLLGDESRIVVIETLKNLKNMTAPFDPAPIVRFMPEMREEDIATAFEILQLKASPQTLPALSVLMTGKSEVFRQQACQIVVDNITPESLEPLLLALDNHEWWGKERAIKCLLSDGDNKLFNAALRLLKHDNEFVRSTADQLSASVTSQTGDLASLSKSLFHDDWQVRDRAIEQIGNSNSKSALTLLNQVLEKKPESTIAVLKAVANLGFSKGLEITSKCLQKKEAAIQREALLTMSKIVTQRHADKVRAGIVSIVPKLQATVRDTALDVINLLTSNFNLPVLNLDEDNLFETRLIKIEENRDKQSLTPLPANKALQQDVEKTEVINFQQVEDLKSGDYWINRYRVIREIGRGAMGRVMLVNDETVGENLILKFMHPELTADANSRERFLRELKYARKISHQNVIRIHDFVVNRGISAISMEYFESKGLDYLIKNQLLKTADQTLKILYQVCEGMWAAHQQDVIHRDLKPSNILVNNNGLAKVVDFGIASANSEKDVTLTKTGMIIGTPAYLSPERAKGFEADHRSDIYALGIIAYNMLNGGLPYKGEPISLLFQHIEGKAIPLRNLDKGIAPDVSMLVEKMMAVELQDRFQSMREVRDAIKKLI